MLGGIGVLPEGIPWDTKFGALKSGAVAQELGVPAVGGVAGLGGGVVVAGVDAVDGIEGVDSITNVAGKGADRVLVSGFGDDTGGTRLELRKGT